MASKSVFRKDGNAKIARIRRELKHELDRIGPAISYDDNRREDARADADRKIADIKAWMAFHTRKNPAGKSVRLTNFSGTITRNANGTVTVKGKRG